MEYEINGRKVSAAQFQRHIEDLPRQVMQDAVDKQLQKARAVTCPTHGKRATVEVQPISGERFEMKVTACCEPMKTRVEHALAA